jgi:acyl-coenzyme A synthetase/AMP-(fatty) acid ligase
MLVEELSLRHAGNPQPMVIRGDVVLGFSAVAAARDVDLGIIGPGDVVALVGDFDPVTINTLLRLIDLKTILVPLSAELENTFDYIFDAASVDVVIRDGEVRRIRQAQADHPMLAQLRAAEHPGLVLFSSGTTGRPKAILHDFESFLVRFRTPRPALKTLNFLLFDHIGGINTLFHTMFNLGQVVIPSGRTPHEVVNDIEAHAIELLPTTPTFLRMLLMSDIVSERPAALSSLRVVTYGTEPMDESTLERLCALLPRVDFRQTFGMSELGILRVKSRARDSLWMSVGGDGVALAMQPTGEPGRSVLMIRSANRMIGYLNAPDPFKDGWYDTGDVVEQDGKWIRVAGVKVLPTEVERVALLHPDVLRAKVEGVANPITGQHVEVTVALRDGAVLDRAAMRSHFAAHLPENVRPHRVKTGDVAFNHRFKKV